MNKAILLHCLQLVSPAFSKNPVPTIFQHFCFSGDRVTVFNDQIAISTWLPDNTIHGALPKSLLKLLKTVPDNEINFELNGKQCVVNWGTSNLKFDVLLPSEFSFFSMPEFLVNIFTEEQLAAFIEGIECCLCSIATDTNVPDRAGITALFEDGKLTLYATNDQTMARAKLTVRDETLNGQIILNAAFCKRLVAAKKKVKAIDISFYGDFILADLTDAMLYGKLLHSKNPIDFATMFRKHLAPVVAEINDDVVEIIERACVVTDKNEMVRITVANNMLNLRSKSMDAITKTVHPEVSVSCNPRLLKQGLARFSHWRITASCIIMATLTDQPNLRYLISTGKLNG